MARAAASIMYDPFGASGSTAWTGSGQPPIQSSEVVARGKPLRDVGRMEGHAVGDSGLLRVLPSTFHLAREVIEPRETRAVKCLGEHDQGAARTASHVRDVDASFQLLDGKVLSQSSIMTLSNQLR